MANTMDPNPDTDPHAPAYETPDASGEDSGFMAGLFEAASGESEPDMPADPEPSMEQPERATEPEVETEEAPEAEPEPQKIDPKTDPDFADAPPFKKEANIIGWKELKRLKATAEKERDEMKAELAKLKAQPASAANTADIEAIRAELAASKTQLADYDKKMALIDVEQSREYRTNIAEPLSRAEELIQSFAEKYQIDIREIAKAATTPNVLDRNQLLSDLVSGMNDFDKYEFKRVVDEAKSLYDRSMQVKQQAQESKKYLEQARAKELEEQQRTQQEEVRRVADSVWTSMQEKLPFLKDAGDDVSRAIAEVKTANLADAPAETQAYARYAAVLLPNLMARLDAQAKELDTMKKSLAKRAAVNPSVRGGGSSRASESEGDSFMSGLEKILS